MSKQLFTRRHAIKTASAGVFGVMANLSFKPFTIVTNSQEKLAIKKNIVLENHNFIYVIDYTGKNLHFIDKTSGIDYLVADSVSYCASIEIEGKKYNVTSVSQHGKQLKYEFGDTGITAYIRLIKSKDRIVFRLLSFTGSAHSLTFINVPLTLTLLEGLTCDVFAACVLSMNLFTHVRQLPALQTHLWASCYEHTGMNGAEVTMLGVPQKIILPVIRDVIKNAKEIPFSDKGGAWAQMEKEGYGSYLRNTRGQLTEETVDEWIEMCQSLGFNQIITHGQSYYREGCFSLNEAKSPDGWDAFKRINKRLHDAGISSLLHTNSFFIAKASKYVTPVPSEDLGYFTAFILAKSANPEDDEIFVNESTSNISTTVGFWVRNSTILRIGNEIVEFSGVTSIPPYKFTGLKRGVLGTKASYHSADERAFHLMEMFGRLVPGSETALFNEIARRTAEIIDDCNFRGIYLDASDGSDLFGGKEFYWHYGTKFLFEVARNLETPVGMEMAGVSHLWWHFRSRWQAWDIPVRGFKRFTDIHLASIKSDSYMHGEFLGHTPIIDKLAKTEHSPLLLPLHLGWRRNQIWNPSPQMEMTFPDDIEYLCSKMIGNNAGLSMTELIDKHPLFEQLHALIKQYEELRHMNYFSDDVRKILRQPGKEFTLFREQNGKWNFKPIVYNKHKAAVRDNAPDEWVVINEFDDQPVKLRIQPLMSVRSYTDHLNELLTDFSNPCEFSNKASALGVTGGLNLSREVAGKAKTSINFSAFSSGVSPREGSWIKLEKIFNPLINLENHQALGVWIKGDGNGQLINFRIGNPNHIGYAGVRGDHFVIVDFTGWKYYELVEIESTRFSDYIWEERVGTKETPEGFNVYNSYYGTVRLDSVDKLQLWYNNLPPGKEVNCIIGPVKALPMIPVTISNPYITIGGEKIVFPVTMESGMYIEFKSKDDCKLFGHNGELFQEITIEGEIPVLQEGNNEVNFACDGPEGITSRVEVTIIGKGDAL